MDGLNCTTEVPPADEYLLSLDGRELIQVSIAGSIGILTLLLHGCFAIEIRARWKQRWTHNRDRLWVLSMLPILCLLFLTGLLVPRMMFLCNIIVYQYTAFCMWRFYRSVVGEFGGYEGFVRMFQGRTMPYGFCAACCPKPPLTGALLRKREMWFIWSLVVTILAGLFGTSLIAVRAPYDDNIFSSGVSTAGMASFFKNPYFYMMIALKLSMVARFWATVMVFSVHPRYFLKRPEFFFKFAVFLLTVSVSVVQYDIFAILRGHGVFGCRPGVPVSTVASETLSLLYILETFVLTICFRLVYSLDFAAAHEVTPYQTPESGLNLSGSFSRAICCAFKHAPPQTVPAELLS